MKTNDYTAHEILDAHLRTDLTSFIHKSFNTIAPGKGYDPNWHVRALAYQLEQVQLGRVKRLVITMPPRMLKSISASVAFPAYLLGHDPGKRIVCVTYAEDLSELHARDCRAVMESDWYRRIFPKTRIGRAKNATLDFETTRRGGRLSTSTGGTLTGRGGSLIIIDDPLRAADGMSVAKRATALDWFRNTLSSRLDDKRDGAIIVVMQRLHVDDLAGHLLEQGGWTHLNLPAIALEDEEIEISKDQFHLRCEGEVLHETREPLTALESIKQDMGSFHFNAQYQQSPVPDEGNLVKWEWFGTFTAPPGADDKGQIVQSWDMAVKDGENNDFSVCITAHIFRKEVHILDIFRKKLDYPSQRKAVIAQAQKHNAKVILIEAAANGSPLVADLKHLNTPGIPTPIAVKPRGSKVERLSVESHRIEAGDVRLPEKAPWRDEFRSELLAFPHGRHDDQVDALSQILTWSSRDSRSRRNTGVALPIFFTLD